MIGLDLDGYFHKNILLTLWISYKISVHILYFVIFFELSTATQNVEFHIHQRYIDTGSFEVIDFCARKMIKMTHFISPWKMINLLQDVLTNFSQSFKKRDVISFTSKVSNVDLSTKFRKIHRKTPKPEPLFNKLAEACNFIKKKTLAEIFFCEYCEISKNALFTEHLWSTASVYGCSSE